MDDKIIDSLIRLTGSMTSTNVSFIKSLVQDDVQLYEELQLHTKSVSQYLQSLHYVADKHRPVSTRKTVTIEICNCSDDPLNEWLLFELSKYGGVKSGDIIHNVNYNPVNKACEFTRNNSHCVAWEGETCKIISK